MNRVSKHEISVARQRYRFGKTHFATLKSFTQWYFDKKQSSGEPPSYFELHITFSERSLQKVTQYSRNTTRVDTDLVTATGTAAISIPRLGRPLYRVFHEPVDTQFRQHRMRRCAVGCLYPVLPPRTSEVKGICSFSMNFDRAANTWRSIDTFYMLHLI